MRQLHISLTRRLLDIKDTAKAVNYSLMKLISLEEDVVPEPTEVKVITIIKHHIDVIEISTQSSETKEKKVKKRCQSNFDYICRIIFR